MSKYWLIIFLLIGILYAAYEGHIPEAQKYVKPVGDQIQAFLSSIQEKAKSGLPQNTLKNYPVKVTYEVSKKTEKGLLGKKYTYYQLTLKFENVGSESVGFLIGGLAIVDDSGNTYSPDRLVFDHITVYPGAVRKVTYPFKSLPSSGMLYIDIYRAENFNVGMWGDMSAQLEKVETFGMTFKYSGS